MDCILGTKIDAGHGGSQGPGEPHAGTPDIVQQKRNKEHRSSKVCHAPRVCPSKFSVLTLNISTNLCACVRGSELESTNSQLLICRVQ